MMRKTRTRENNNRNNLCFAIFLVGTALAVTMFASNNSDEYADEQWYLSANNEYINIGEPDAVSRSNKELISSIINIRKGRLKHNNRETIVAVIDTQVDWSHEDLKGKAWQNAKEIPNDHIDNDNNGYMDDYYGYNFLEEIGISSLKTKKPGAHGTAITGLICANMNNGVGIAGLTGEANVKVMNLAVLDSITTEGDVNNLTKAILYAEENGAKICNISANYTEPNDELFHVIQQSKMLFVVSAGNCPTLGLSIDKVVNIPAMYNFNNVVTVSALTQESRILRQANYGAKTVDILAPGDEILAPIPKDQYAYFSGTSIATPMITGIAALVDQSHVEISASQLRDQLLSIAYHDEDFAYKIKDGAYLQFPKIIFD